MNNTNVQFYVVKLQAKAEKMQSHKKIEAFAKKYLKMQLTVDRLCI